LRRVEVSTSSSLHRCHHGVEVRVAVALFPVLGALLQTVACLLGARGEALVATGLGRAANSEAGVALIAARGEDVF
jgi:hypothetical protein